MLNQQQVRGVQGSQSEAALEQVLASQVLLSAMVHFFETDGWPMEVNPATGLILTKYQGDQGFWACCARAREAACQIVFYSICPLICPPSRRLEMAEFLCRVNHGLILGNFEIDWEDGEIRFKCSMDVEGIPIQEPGISFPLIKQMVYTNVMTMDKYMPGLVAVLSQTKPEAAIALVETPAA